MEWLGARNLQVYGSTNLTFHWTKRDHIFSCIWVSVSLLFKVSNMFAICIQLYHYALMTSALQHILNVAPLAPTVANPIHFVYTRFLNLTSGIWIQYNCSRWSWPKKLNSSSYKYLRECHKYAWRFKKKRKKGKRLDVIDQN